VNHISKGRQALTTPSLGELALVFLKLGTIAFGGPAAHLALMETEVVNAPSLAYPRGVSRRASAPRNLLPGPSSTELAIFIAMRSAGLPGLLTAGVCFIVPAAVLVSVIAAGYVRYGGLPQVSGMLYALKPVVIAVVLQAFWNSPARRRNRAGWWSLALWPELLCGRNARAARPSHRCRPQPRPRS